mmetsp:Transcript_1623/g.3558  ORF Transcript_1623/g.3558 Transcript_1623/m.3558 type:complete len:217 (+) Transcript_1623:49-699(+)
MNCSLIVQLFGYKFVIILLHDIVHCLSPLQKFPRQLSNISITPPLLFTLLHFLQCLPCKHASHSILHRRVIISLKYLTRQLPLTIAIFLFIQDYLLHLLFVLQLDPETKLGVRRAVLLRLLLSHTEGKRLGAHGREPPALDLQSQLAPQQSLAALDGGLAGEHPSAREPPVRLRLHASLPGEDVRAGRIQEQDVRAALDEVVEGHAVLIVGEKCSA